MVELIIKDKVYVEGLDSDTIDIIVRDLTFSNPKYAKIMRYSKYGSTKEPKFLSYYDIFKERGKQIVEVPIGYINRLLEIIPDEEVDITDYRRARKQVAFPKFELELRDTQKQALDSYLKANSDLSHLSGGIILPTGKGKTILGLAIAATLKTKTLIIVHKDDLVKGWERSIAMCFKSASVGKIKAGARKIGEHFTIATIQTLNRLTQIELNALYDKFGLIIQDEMHHCPSTSFSLADNFLARYRLGLTATPERNDGLDHIMKLYYGDFCFNYATDYKGKDKDLKEKDILPVKVFLKEPKLFFNPVCTLKGRGYVLPDNLADKKHFNRDYVLSKGERRIQNVISDMRPTLSYSQADLIVTNSPIVSKMVCEDILSEFNKGHSCIVFFKQVESLLNYKQLLIDLGIEENLIGLYYGGNKKSDEVRELAENNRKYITLTTLSKATEGTDVQQWEVCFLVSSMNNGKDVEQAVGRVRRLKSNGNKLKEALVYDYSYNSCYPMYMHSKTRISRYKKLQFKIVGSVNPDQHKSLFKRGYGIFDN